MSTSQRSAELLTTLGQPDPAPADLTLVGSELEVPLVTGARRRYVNLDYAASAPCLASVKRAVDALLPWYASVHRGAGYKSQLATEAYEGARAAVRSFVGARSSDTVVFTRNTTDAINLLAAALPPDAEVLALPPSITPTCCRGAVTGLPTCRCRQARPRPWNASTAHWQRDPASLGWWR